VYYQPQIDIIAEKLCGIEALARWQSPEMGMVLPDQFIPLAEETGFISEIGRWVLKNVCAEGKKWLELGLDPVRISVNISAHQLHRVDFIDEVRSIMDASGYEPGNIEFELTESILIIDNLITLKKLEMLKNMGVSLAIDDFGTKYSSLSYLKRLPIDRIKIDRSFIKDLPADGDSRKIVSAIIAMGNSLNLEVVAEGVETEKQVLFLKEMGCSIIQGNYFSIPLAPDDIFNFQMEKQQKKVEVLR
jgi:EAL domain-containing protein (putative c-di-GMP-specific phosphodiesterase class I)